MHGRGESMRDGKYRLRCLCYSVRYYLEDEVALEGTLFFSVLRTTGSDIQASRERHGASSAVTKYQCSLQSQ